MERGKGLVVDSERADILRDLWGPLAEKMASLRVAGEMPDAENRGRLGCSMGVCTGAGAGRRKSLDRRSVE